jgi:hypothetical protein
MMAWIANTGVIMRKSRELETDGEDVRIVRATFFANSPREFMSHRSNAYKQKFGDAPQCLYSAMALLLGAYATPSSWFATRWLPKELRNSPREVLWRLIQECQRSS